MFAKTPPTRVHTPIKPLEVPPRYLKVPPDPGGSATTSCDTQAPHNKYDGNIAQQQHDAGHCDHRSTRHTTPSSATARTEGTMPLFVLPSSCGPPTRLDASENAQPTTPTAVVRQHGTRPPTTMNGRAHSTPHHPSYWGRDPNVEQKHSTSSRHKCCCDDAPSRPPCNHRMVKPAPIEPERHHALWSINSRYVKGRKCQNDDAQRVKSKRRRRPRRRAHSDATRGGIEPGGRQTTGLIDLRYVRGPKPQKPDVRRVQHRRRCHQPRRDHCTRSTAPIEPERHHALWSIDFRYVRGRKPQNDGVRRVKTIQRRHLPQRATIDDAMPLGGPRAPGTAYTYINGNYSVPERPTLSGITTFPIPCCRLP
jgi:hypothetical protein